MTSEPPVHDWRLSSGPDQPAAAAPRLSSTPVDALAGAPSLGRSGSARPGTRAVAFTLALVGLLAAVPVLTWMGLRLIRDSRAGHFVDGVTDPAAPGYEALVEPTPTALVVEKDADGRPVGLVVLSLGVAGGGGSAMFVPLNTRVESAGYGVDRLRGAFELGGERNLVAQAAGLLRVGFSDVIDIDPAQWSELTAPVAPLRIDNPDAVAAGEETFPAGPVSLESNQVADYLEATAPGESELNLLNRQELFWEEWLRAIGDSDDPAVVPGEAESGLGLYLRTLAGGPVTFEPLPLRQEPTPVRSGLLTTNPDALRATIARMVPFPASPFPGSRPTVRLLNGADGEPIPPALIRQLVTAGGSVSWIGNDRRFGREQTLIEYREEARRGDALAVRSALGGVGRVRRNDRASDSVDMTVIVGRDALDRVATSAAAPPASPVAPATSPGTTTGPTDSTRGSTAIGG